MRSARACARDRAPALADSGCPGLREFSLSPEILPVPPGVVAQRAANALTVVPLHTVVKKFWNTASCDNTAPGQPHSPAVTPTARDNAVLPAQSIRRRKGLCLLGHSKLPGKLWDVRL